MLLVIAILVASTALIIGMCTRNSPASSAKQANPPIAKQSPQLAPKDSALKVSVKVSVSPLDSPPHSQKTQPHHIESATPVENSGAPCKVNSPGGSANNTGTDTNGTTPQSSVKREQVKTKEFEPSQESQDLLIQTISIGRDSIIETGHTTRTKVDPSKYHKPSRKIKGRKLSLDKEKTARTIESPGKKTEKEEERKKGIMTALRGLCHNDDPEEEGTGQEPTDDRLKMSRIKEKDDTNNKTKEDNRTVEGKLSTAPSVMDDTQQSMTRKGARK